MTHNKESEDSLDRLNDLYGGPPGSPGYIDKSMALMVTKVAIWKVLTDNDPNRYFELDDSDPTILHSVPGRGDVFDNLLERLVEDAKRARALEAPGNYDYTKLKTDIKDDNARRLSGVDSNAVYYGPLTVEVELIDLPAGSAGPAGTVYLELLGAELNNISFVTDRLSDQWSGGTGKIPGTQTDAQTISVAIPGSGARKWVSGEFYLKVPAARKDAIGAEQAYFDLTVFAKAQMNDVLVQEGTPLPIAAIKDGIQGWDIVQAFIGATRSGAAVTMYAEDSFVTRDVGTNGGAVQTSDDRSLVLPIVAIALGVLFIAGAEIYRRKLGRKAAR